MTTPPPDQDTLVARYHAANAALPEHPHPAVRERVLAQALAQTRVRRGAPEAAGLTPPPDTAAHVANELTSASAPLPMADWTHPAHAKQSAVAGAGNADATSQAKPRAANEANWRLRAVASLAAVAVVGTLAFQHLRPERIHADMASVSADALTRARTAPLPMPLPAEPMSETAPHAPLAEPAPPATITMPAAESAATHRAAPPAAPLPDSRPVPAAAPATSPVPAVTPSLEATHDGGATPDAKARQREHAPMPLETPSHAAERADSSTAVAAHSTADAERQARQAASAQPAAPAMKAPDAVVAMAPPMPAAAPPMPMAPAPAADHGPPQTHSAPPPEAQAAAFRELLSAVHAGRPIDVQRAVAQGAPVNATDPQGFTPLMLAARRGDLAMVQELLALGALQTPRAPQGQTVLELAVQHGHTAVADWLRAH